MKKGKKETKSVKATRCGQRYSERKYWARELGVPVRCLRWRNGRLYYKGGVVRGSKYLPKSAA